jgi:hypothetical protein
VLLQPLASSERDITAENIPMHMQTAFRFGVVLLKGSNVFSRYRESFVYAEHTLSVRIFLREQGWYRVFNVPYGKISRKGFFYYKK